MGVFDAMVAPRAGAWIETENNTIRSNAKQQVAPRAGAWIETRIRLSFCTAKGVAPRAGAWIETQGNGHIRHNPRPSHPVRVRGLKRAVGWQWKQHSLSHPVRVRGLKPVYPESWVEEQERRTPCGCVD